MFPMIVISLTLKAKIEMMRVICLSLARTLMIQTIRKGLLSTKIIRQISQVTVKAKHGKMKQQHPLEEEQVEEAEEGHVEEGCMEPLQEGCDHDPL